MFCSFCTTPAEPDSSFVNRQQPSAGRTVWIWLLMLIWAVLMAVALVSQLNPSWLQAWAESGVVAEAGAYKQYGDSFLKKGELGMAIAQYQKAYQIDPGQVSVMTNLAAAYMHAGQSAKAAKILRAAEKAAASHKGPIYYNCGELLRQQGKLEEALIYYQRAVGTTVDQSLVQRQMAQTFLDLGRLTEARQAFELALEHQSDPRRSYQEMLLDGLQRYERDTIHLPIIEKLYTDQMTIEQLIAYDFGVIRERLASDAEIAKTHNHLGLIAIRTEDLEAARSHFMQSAAIWPGNVDASRGLSLLASLPAKQKSPGNMTTGGQ